MSEKLCPTCSATGECQFEKNAKLIAGMVPEAGDLEQPSVQAEEASIEIRIMRAEARKMRCPNLNDIDPDYPGRNLL